MSFTLMISIFAQKITEIDIADFIPTFYILYTITDGGNTYYHDNHRNHHYNDHQKLDSLGEILNTKEITKIRGFSMIDERNGEIMSDDFFNDLLREMVDSI